MKELKLIMLVGTTMFALLFTWTAISGYIAVCKDPIHNRINLWSFAFIVSWLSYASYRLFKSLTSKP